MKWKKDENHLQTQFCKCSSNHIENCKKVYLLGGEFANEAKAIKLEEKEQGEELGKEDGVFGKVHGGVGTTIQALTRVVGQLSDVHKTHKLFTRSRYHAHCFFDLGWERKGRQCHCVFLRFVWGGRRGRGRMRFVWNLCWTKVVNSLWIFKYFF